MMKSNLPKTMVTSKFEFNNALCVKTIKHYFILLRRLLQIRIASKGKILHEMHFLKVFNPITMYPCQEIYNDWFQKIPKYRMLANLFLCIQQVKFVFFLYFSRLISYFEPLCTLNPVFGAILMRMSAIFIVGQSGAIIGRGDSYQGLSADSYHL